MKEELQSKIVEILSSMQAAAGKAGDFAIEQLPDIAQSYVVYGRAYGILMVLLGCALIALAIFLLARGWRSYNEGEAEYKKSNPRGEYRILYRDNFKTGLPCFLAAGAASVLGGIFVLANLGTTMLVWFAPKVWLLKELAGMVR